MFKDWWSLHVQTYWKQHEDLDCSPRFSLLLGLWSTMLCPWRMSKLDDSGRIDPGNNGTKSHVVSITTTSRLGFGSRMSRLLFERSCCSWLHNIHLWSRSTQMHSLWGWLCWYLLRNMSNLCHCWCCLCCTEVGIDGWSWTVVQFSSFSVAMWCWVESMDPSSMRLLIFQLLGSVPRLAWTIHTVCTGLWSTMTTMSMFVRCWMTTCTSMTPIAKLAFPVIEDAVMTSEMALVDCTIQPLRSHFLGALPAALADLSWLGTYEYDIHALTVNKDSGDVCHTFWDNFVCAYGQTWFGGDAVVVIDKQNQIKTL